MFYVPYKFKSQDEPTTPRGPNFSRAPRIETFFNGTKISLKLPRHKTTLRSGYLTPEKIININESNFETVDSKKSTLKVFNLFSRVWDFNGHSFMGRVCVLSVSGNIMLFTSQPKNTSYFHPNFFENTISDYLHQFFCLHEDRYEDADPYHWVYRAPTNWSIINVSDELQAAKFNVVKNTDYKTGYSQSKILFPISNRFIFSLNFRLERNVNLKNNMPIDDWINPKYCDELCENIIDSIDIVLSEEAKKQRELALQGVANPKLSETFAPIDWPKDGVLKEKFDIENDDGWGEYS